MSWAFNEVKGRQMRNKMLLSKKRKKRKEDDLIEGGKREM